MQVKNRRCIRRLSWKSMQAARMRNIIAVLAIALTTLLFTALFTIAFTINESIQDNSFRQVGGYEHGGFKYLTEEQFNVLKEDSLIKEYGVRRVLGMSTQVPFNKSHVEVSYSDANTARWMFCEPKVGRLPEEGTDEAATDLRVLELLGVEPKLGAQFTMIIDVDDIPTTQTFTLCGWWDYDEASVANLVQIPESRLDEIFAQLNVEPHNIYGTRNLSVMLDSTMHIEQDLNTILTNHGYQNETFGREDYISSGVNWAYTGAQMANNIDAATMTAIVAVLLIIIFTGYLIIYNIFQISVTNDIRFYGLLKTIGTTGRQMKRIVRQQALLLSALGIPLGLILGYGAGCILTPVVASELNGLTMGFRSANPLIFISAALFALITVLISCHKPGRMAAKVSPVEAVRYAEGGKQSRRKENKKCRENKQKQLHHQRKTGISLPKMAWANLERSRGKTIVTVVSLSLAVVLMNLTVTFTNGLDIEKYVVRNITADFIVADASYFQTNGVLFNADVALPEEVITQLQGLGGVEIGGRIYGGTTVTQEFVTEAYFRDRYSRWTDEKYMDTWVAMQDRDANGLLSDNVDLYGMERYVLEKLKLLEGDISKLFEPGTHYIAAVYRYDDYNHPIEGSHWAKVGDKITLRHVDEFEYYNPETGALVTDEEIEAGVAYHARAKAYRDEQYEVAALVGVPNSLSYRYHGSDEFVLNDQTFIQDTGTNNIMQYSFDTADADDERMEAFLNDFTNNQQPRFDYESKAVIKAEFESMRAMFLIMGGVLSFIIGLVGVLNFVNAILTGILVRRQEFAVLQSIGMTGKQLKTMLVWEGVYYAAAAVMLSLGLSLAAGPICAVALTSMFWFYTYHFTIGPIMCVAPIFIALGVLLPLIVYRFAAKRSIVERLRQVD